MSSLAVASLKLSCWFKLLLLPLFLPFLPFDPLPLPLLPLYGWHFRFLLLFLLLVITTVCLLAVSRIGEEVEEEIMFEGFVRIWVQIKSPAEVTSIVDTCQKHEFLLKMRSLKSIYFSLLSTIVFVKDLTIGSVRHWIVNRKKLKSGNWLDVRIKYKSCSFNFLLLKTIHTGTRWNKLERRRRSRLETV